MRISDWSSDVCSSDLHLPGRRVDHLRPRVAQQQGFVALAPIPARMRGAHGLVDEVRRQQGRESSLRLPDWSAGQHGCRPRTRSEEHTSELQSLMRISYAVFCLKKKQYCHNL